MKTKHFAQLVMLSALWGASFMLIRLASPVLGPNVLAALRIGMATLTLAVLMFTLRQPWPRGHWRELALIGLLSVALPFLLFAWAALQIPAGYSALLNSTAVLFGMLGQPQWAGVPGVPAGPVFSTVFYISLLFTFNDSFGGSPVQVDALQAGDGSPPAGP